MKVAKDTVVSLDYRLHLGDGKVFDESEPGDPLVYLHGHGEIVPGLEKAVEGKSVGDTVKAVVPPEEGYGDHDPEAVQEVPREELPEGELEVGGTLYGTDDEGDEMEALVKEVREKTVVLDFNPPLAGKTLHFEVKVREVRAATKEELEHSHAHGPGHEH
ncbi:MAG: peptidylprolyl isomerase [Myxococcaceae bacterium]|nr:peptidylprolyl isomerase [Myxococcaceae bacterium]MCI0673217.1 peptidylprolyl isomerase [Myxococcaceae bacterium]